MLGKDYTSLLVFCAVSATVIGLYLIIGASYLEYRRQFIANFELQLKRNFIAIHPIALFAANLAGIILFALLGYFLLGKDSQAVNLVTGIAYPYIGGITDTVQNSEQAASFDGASGTYIPIFSYDLSAGFTVYGKQRFNDGTVDAALWGAGTGSNHAGMFQAWRDETTTDRFGMGFYDTAWRVFYTTSPTPNEIDWYSWGVTYDSIRLKLMVNGAVEHTTGTQTLSSSTEIINIGSALNSTAKNHDGEISYFCFYNRALTDDEIKRLNNSPYQFLIPE